MKPQNTVFWVRARDMGQIRLDLSTAGYLEELQGIFWIFRVFAKLPEAFGMAEEPEGSWYRGT
ncbi:hypothetical protein N7537_008197 [Penicillium hordei]|uniref:Uncharacterized protein n=1 Tax=Penicillium hordei TaxID=40994 RepID=A0AAD6H1F4_9EURO|nr:uncharacterized protein N7537_008197 [Penicillium hordei]KAJ5598113.1 hypothetical protein N7537_008197 [Penicillium hordei]